MRHKILLVFTATVTLLSGHARFDPNGVVKPRSPSSGLKTGPCGGVAATEDPAQRTILTAGEEITVSWDETINHPGWFRIAFSPEGDSGFEDNILKDNIIDDQGSGPNISDPATYNKFSTTIIVPETTCENCSLQLIQYMTDRDPPTLYYSCADIRIVDGNDSAAKPDAPTNVKIEWQEAP